MSKPQGSYVAYGQDVQIDATSDSDNFIIRLPKRGKGTMSASGKSTVLASTRGSIALNDGEGGVVRLGLNLFR